LRNAGGRIDRRLRYGSSEMADLGVAERAERRGRGGAEARRAVRRAAPSEHLRYITRRIPSFSVMNEEALATIEANADLVLEEVGLEFRGDAEVLQLWRDAGCDVQGERVHFPRGLCRRLVVENAPATFVQHARNADRSVVIGGPHSV